MENNQFPELEDIAVSPTTFFLNKDLVKTDKPEKALKVQFKQRDITIPASLDAVDIIAKYALDGIYDRYKSVSNPDTWQENFRKELSYKALKFKDKPVVYLVDSVGNIYKTVNSKELNKWPLIEERIQLIVSERRSLLNWLCTTEPKNIKSFGTVLKTKLSPHEIWALSVYMSQLGLIQFQTKGKKAKRSKVVHWLSEHVLTNVSKGGNSFSSVDRSVPWNNISIGGHKAYFQGPHYNVVNSDFEPEEGDEKFDAYDENTLLFTDELKVLAKALQSLSK